MEEHVDELERAREEQLNELGALALDMYRREGIDRELLEARAEEIAEIQAEIDLFRRGLEEGIGIKKLRKLAESD